MKFLFKFMALTLIMGCSSTPEIVTVKPELPRLQVYELPVMKNIPFSHTGDQIYTKDSNYADLVNKMAIFKATVDSYEKEITAYIIFLNEYNKR
jgi:hypothetical protein